jgi:hypothetical protein
MTQNGKAPLIVLMSTCVAARLLMLSNHVMDYTWDFYASTMVRPIKSTEDGTDSSSASSAAVTSTIHELRCSHIAK